MLLDNSRHSSLSATAFRREFLPDLRKVLEDSKDVMVDVRLWEAMDKRRKGLLASKYPLSIGLKGLWGTPGLGWGHAFEESWHEDLELLTIRELMGKDVWNYHAPLGAYDPQGLGLSCDETQSCTITPGTMSDHTSIYEGALCN